MTTPIIRSAYDAASGAHFVCCGKKLPTSLCVRHLVRVHGWTPDQAAQHLEAIKTTQRTGRQRRAMPVAPIWSCADPWPRQWCRPHDLWLCEACYTGHIQSVHGVDPGVLWRILEGYTEGLGERLV